MQRVQQFSAGPNKVKEAIINKYGAPTEQSAWQTTWGTSVEKFHSCFQMFSMHMVEDIETIDARKREDSAGGLRGGAKWWLYWAKSLGCEGQVMSYHIRDKKEYGTKTDQMVIDYDLSKEAAIHALQVLEQEAKIELEENKRKRELYDQEQEKKRKEKQEKELRERQRKQKIMDAAEVDPERI
jgi:hypothetical protein